MLEAGEKSRQNVNEAKQKVKGGRSQSPGRNDNAMGPRTSGPPRDLIIIARPWKLVLGEIHGKKTH